MDHDWHLFDEVHGYEVRHVDGEWHVREVGARDVMRARLTEAEFDQWRSEGPNPKGLA